MLGSKEDENILRIVTKDEAKYARNNVVGEELSQEQLIELDEAISEVDNDQTMDWNDFKKEMNESKR